MDALTLRIPDEDRLTDDELFRICSANKELRIERDEEGQLIIMSTAGSSSSNRNFILNSIFGVWVESHSQLGYGFDSSGGFILPDRSMRSPDSAWIKKERWEALTLEAQEKFAKYRAACIMQWAMIEGPCLFCCICFFLVGNYAFLASAGFAAGLLEDLVADLAFAFAGAFFCCFFEPPCFSLEIDSLR